jgi:hypothetical protein
VHRANDASFTTNTQDPVGFLDSPLWIGPILDAELRKPKAWIVNLLKTQLMKKDI